MRAAPAVAVEAMPTARLRTIQALLAAGAAASLAAWAVQHLGRFDVAAWAGAAAAAVGAALGWRAPTTLRARLAWTGAGWELQLPGSGGGGESTAPPEVALDLGGWMLVRVRRPGRGSVWAEVSQGSAGAAWLAWRTAVYSPAHHSPRRSAEEQSPP
jgi:hypothetical protein